MKFTVYLPVLILVVMLAGLELALEARHYHRGFATMIFGTKPVEHKPANNSVKSSGFGPTSGFPFRSRLPEDRDENSLIIWIASASHAEHNRYAVEDLFPNSICTELYISDQQCLVVNGSRAGLMIEANIDLLETWRSTIQPDIVVLYQMANFISSVQRNPGSSESAEASRPNTFDALMNPLSVVVQRSSLYAHLSEFVTANLRLSGPIAHLDVDFEALFKVKLDSFIDYTISIGARPALMTFAVAHNQDNVAAANRSFLTTLIRQNRNLSVSQYIATVESLNNLIRQTGRAREVVVLDLAETIGGKSEYFVDFVHFNKEGHKAVAASVADMLRDSAELALD